MTKFDELIAKLSELFELDKADLDFGIHRIIKSQQKRIQMYLGLLEVPEKCKLKPLGEKVKDVLGDLAQAESAGNLTELKQSIRDNLAADAIDDDGNLADEYKATKLGKQYLAALESATDAKAAERIETEVYSHLYNFFSRYYEDADFISLRRRTAGKETYSIPYDGQEVVLHWTNKDQYYIKSSEDLKDYTFTTHAGEKSFRIQFKLTRMDAIQNNNKASRIFKIDDEAEIKADGDTLVIPFHFAEGKKRTNPQAAAWEQSVLDALPQAWQTRLNAKDDTYTGKDKDGRTLLQKHLRNYTKKNTSDYFIHKDLGGFLRRELDFYIKNEVMYLDDIDRRPADYLEKELRKIKAVRAVAHDLIDFLAQFENFQKRIWLKKKFVIETNWCITLDRVPESFYAEIAANDAQRAEWVTLFAIDEIEADALGKVAYAEPLTVEFLKANDKLVLDTANFEPDFKYRLLAEMQGHEDIDTHTNGLLVHSDNFQALNFLQERYRGQVKCVYIDPPYNTERDRAEGKFLYKDTYEHSSWLSMMSCRIEASISLLNRSTFAYYMSLDESELSNGIKLLDFGKIHGIFTWRRTRTGGHLSKSFNQLSDYVIVCAPHNGEGAWLYGGQADPEESQPLTKNSNTTKELVFQAGSVRFLDYAAGTIQAGTYSNGNIELKNHIEVLDNCNKKAFCVEACFTWGQEMLDYELARGSRIIIKRVANMNPRFLRVPEGHKPLPSLSDGNFTVGVNEDASDELSSMLGYKPIGAYPKPTDLVQKLVQSKAYFDRHLTVLDYFAGTGTTAHAIIKLRRDKTQGGDCKYLLVEMGEYFETILRPRILKGIYSANWDSGKPITRDTGISHCFKYLRLESYEDALNNLELEDRTPDLLGLDIPKKVAEDYLLRYALDVETRASLLSLERFADPFGCTLKIYNRQSGEAEPTPIDLPETFNYLLGLRVRTMQMRDEFLVIEGENPAAETVLVIWRNVKEKDNTALEKFVTKTLRINPADTEYAAIYINGDTTLDDPHKKILLIEKAFHELMFDVEGL